MTTEILKVIQEMRDRKINHGRESSPTLEAWADRLEAALPQQADPTDTFTAADMATAAAQGFRDGQAAAEQAAAQAEPDHVEDMRAMLAAAPAPEPASPWINGLPPIGALVEARIPHHARDGRQMLWAEVEVLQHAIIQGAVYSWVKETGHDGGFYAPMMLSFRPLPSAPEQQPVAWRDETGTLYPSRESVAKYLPEGRIATPLYAAPIAQTEQQPVVDATFIGDVADSLISVITEKGVHLSVREATQIIREALVGLSTQRGEA